MKKNLYCFCDCTFFLNEKIEKHFCHYNDNKLYLLYFTLYYTHIVNKKKQ